jgi:hypothetical protein
MSLLALLAAINAWVCQYLAAFCLLTLGVAIAGRWHTFKRWDAITRDFTLCLASIAMLTLLLATVPRSSASVLWPPITWFAFTMLLMMELLWTVFLLEQVAIGLRRLPGWIRHKLHPEVPPAPAGTPYARPHEVTAIPELHGR